MLTLRQRLWPILCCHAGGAKTEAGRGGKQASLIHCRLMQRQQLCMTVHVLHVYLGTYVKRERSGWGGKTEKAIPLKKRELRQTLKSMEHT